jgi:hypothetical protein
MFSGHPPWPTVSAPRWPATTRGVDEAAALRRALKRSRRREQLRASSPRAAAFFFFLLATFIVPIGAMLDPRVFDSEVAGIIAAVTAELAHWGWPPTAARRRVRGADRGTFGAAREAGTLASAADAAQLRRRRIPIAALFTTGRRLGGDVTGFSARDPSSRSIPSGASARTWAVIRRAAGPRHRFLPPSRAGSAAPTRGARSPRRRPSRRSSATSLGARC